MINTEADENERIFVEKCKVLRHQLQFDERKRIYKPVPAPEESIPDTCQECGGTCTKTERQLCLSELDGRFC